MFRVCFTLFLSSAVCGDRCLNLDGTWYGEHGSVLVLNHTEDGMLFGEIRPQFPTTVGQNSTRSSRLSLIGASPYNSSGTVFGLSLSSIDGSWTISSTGQCLYCDDEEMLETSWLMRRQLADGCSDRWSSTLIGRSVFVRRPWPGNRYRRDFNYILSQLHQHHPEPPNRRRTQRDVHGGIRPCSITGYWYNELGSEMFISSHDSNVIIGEYRTAVERRSGAAGSSHSIVYGMANSSDPHSALAFFVVWNNGDSITGWVGQCSLCGNNRVETLQTAWLHRSKVSSCDDNWKSTNYGENSFSRQQQRNGTSRRLGIHTPGQVGEVWSTGANSSPCKPFFSLSHLMGLAAFIVVIMT